MKKWLIVAMASLVFCGIPQSTVADTVSPQNIQQSHIETVEVIFCELVQTKDGTVVIFCLLWVNDEYLDFIVIPVGVVPKD